MSRSYLSTSIYLPLAQETVENLLQQPIGLPSPSLRSLLDETLAGLIHRKPDAITYYPDAAWLEQHIAYCAALTGWEYLTLMRALATDRANDWLSESAFGRGASAISHLAFAYADAALAEKLAAVLPEDEYGELTVSPSSDKDAKTLLLHRHGFQVSVQAYPAQRHPVSRALSDARTAMRLKNASWAALEAKRQAQDLAGQPLLQAWQTWEGEQLKNAISGATAAQPLDLGVNHFTDGTQVFFRHVHGDDAPVLLKDCDLATFKDLEDFESNGWFAADATHLWNCGAALPCDHPQQFKPMAIDNRYFSDGRYVYYDYSVQDGVDARKVRAVQGNEEVPYARGFLHEDIFHAGWHGRFQVDAASFRAEGEGTGREFYADINGAYELDNGELHLIEGIDPATFAVIEHSGETYFKDYANIAHVRPNGLKPKFLKSADVAKFRAIKGLPFMTDEKRIWMGAKLCKELDPEQLRLAPPHSEMRVDHGWCVNEDEQLYFICGQQVFYVRGDQYRVLAEADLASFEILDVPFARDARHMWFWGELIEGIQVANFAWMDASRTHWTDGKNEYIRDEKIPEKFCGPKVERLSSIDPELLRAGDDYFLDGARIKGWSAATHRVSDINCIEDKQYYYTGYSNEGGAILVWSKQSADYPLVHYARDQKSNIWQLAAKIPAVKDWASVPPTLISREEFDTLFACLPQGREFAETQSTFNNPDFVVDYLRDSRTLRISGAVKYGAYWYSEELQESISPARTVALCQQIRDTLQRILDATSPISIDTLDALVDRIPAGEGSVSFVLDHNDSTDIETGQIDIQDGAELLRGVWLDVREKGCKEVLRMFVHADGDFLAAQCMTGPASLFGQGENDGFSSGHWTLQRRTLFRELVAAVLKDIPAARSSSQSSQKKHSSAAESWLAQSLDEVIALIAPARSQAEQNENAQTIRDACATQTPEEAADEYSTLEAIVWEELLYGQSGIDGHIR